MINQRSNQQRIGHKLFNNRFHFCSPLCFDWWWPRRSYRRFLRYLPLRLGSMTSWWVLVCTKRLKKYLIRLYKYHKRHLHWRKLRRMLRRQRKKRTPLWEVLRIQLLGLLCITLLLIVYVIFFIGKIIDIIIRTD